MSKVSELGFIKKNPYTVSGDFTSMLQDLIPKVIPSQKCHMNTGPILSGYGAMDMRNSRPEHTSNTITDVLPA
jgi:hypothetical protein